VECLASRTERKKIEGVKGVKIEPEGANNGEEGVQRENSAERGLSYPRAL